MVSLYVDGEYVELNVFLFPGGEVHYKIEQFFFYTTKSKFVIKTNFQCPSDIMVVLMLADQLVREHVELEMQYIPYSRQDRITSHYEPFSFKTFAKIINSCNFKDVLIFDPHSDVTPALLNNCTVVDRVSLINNVRNYDIIVSPDAGAMKENNKICKKWEKQHIVATKVRDVKTGEITNTKIHTDLDISGKRLLVIDDICDGGRTFIELSKVLRIKNPLKIDLFVTYGIFSNGKKPLFECFDNVTAHFDFKKGGII